jgi:hypothetical protein
MKTVAGTKLKPGRKKVVVEKNMLDNMKAKFHYNDVNELVYKLSFAKKFIIVKGKTLYGSLSIIADTFDYFTRHKDKYKNHLYVNLYNHYIRHRHMRFTVRILAKKDAKTSHFDLLKREQMELDKNKNNDACLNNTKNAYIPIYNDHNGNFGWLEGKDVFKFMEWLESKERKTYLRKYCSRS